jgi:hypothetical protein
LEWQPSYFVRRVHADIISGGESPASKKVKNRTLSNRVTLAIHITGLTSPKSPLRKPTTHFLFSPTKMKKGNLYTADWALLMPDVTKYCSIFSLAAIN